MQTEAQPVPAVPTPSACAEEAILRESSESLHAVLYEELRRLAASYLRRNSPASSLQPTLLVHESFVRLMERTKSAPRDKEHYFALAARIMRHILVDHARRRAARKRTLEVAFATQPLRQHHGESTNLLEFEELLNKLEGLCPRQAQIVELRCFAGMTTATIAQLLCVSKRTVELDWQMAKRWLSDNLRKG